MFDYANRAKPVIKWAGGKSNLLPRLLEIFPRRFHRYVEPFAGGASTFLSLKPGTPAVLNDALLDLVATYRVIRQMPTELMHHLDGMRARYSADYYRIVRDKSPELDIERASRFIFLNKTCFNGLYRTNAKGKFNVPFGKRVKCPALYDRDNLLAVGDRLRGAEILHGDFEAVLDAAREGDLVYCDPPYAPVSKTASFAGYLPGGFTWRDHERLKHAAVRAAQRGATVVITNSATEPVRALYADLALTTVYAPRHINSKGNRRGRVPELVAVTA